MRSSTSQDKYEIVAIRGQTLVDVLTMGDLQLLPGVLAGGGGGGPP